MKISISIREFTKQLYDRLILLILNFVSLFFIFGDFNKFISNVISLKIPDLYDFLLNMYDM